MFASLRVAHARKGAPAHARMHAPVPAANATSSTSSCVSKWREGLTISGQCLTVRWMSMIAKLRQSDTDTDTDTDRHRQTQTDTDRHRQTHTQTQIHMCIRIHTQVSTQTDAQRHKRMRQGGTCQPRQTHKGTRTHAHALQGHRPCFKILLGGVDLCCQRANTVQCLSAQVSGNTNVRACVCMCLCVCVCVCPSARWARAHASAASARRPTPPNHAPSADCRGPGVRQTSS